MNNLTEQNIYLDTAICDLMEAGVIDISVYRACNAAKPPMVTAGDILEHLDAKGSFSDVPGCRRPGRIPDTLMSIAGKVIATETPAEERPHNIKRREIGKLSQEAHFEFLSEDQRREILDYRQKYGHLPMFKILKFYLNRPDASRNDLIMAYTFGLSAAQGDNSTLAEIAQLVNLSRERVRQIAINYEFPEQLRHPRLWMQYADHSTYFVNPSNDAFNLVRTTEVEDLPFASYAMILQRTTMLQNVDDLYLARQGWVDEITAWYTKLSRLKSMTRFIDSRISLEGLAMGGALDLRINLVVLHQIAPALGITPDAPDAIILPKNA